MVNLSYSQTLRKRNSDKDSPFDTIPPIVRITQGDKTLQTSIHKCQAEWREERALYQLAPQDGGEA